MSEYFCAEFLIKVVMFLRKCILVALLPVATVFSAEAGDKRKGFSFRQDSVSIEAGAASDNS